MERSTATGRRCSPGREHGVIRPETASPFCDWPFCARAREAQKLSGRHTNLRNETALCAYKKLGPQGHQSTSMGLKGHYHHHHPCLKAFCFILILAAIAAGIFLLVFGALCFQAPYPQSYPYPYCSSLQYGGFLALLIVGACLAPIFLLVMILCCCCCCCAP